SALAAIPHSLHTVSLTPPSPTLSLRCMRCSILLPPSPTLPCSIRPTLCDASSSPIHALALSASLFLLSAMALSPDQTPSLLLPSPLASSLPLAAHPPVR